MRLPGLIEHLRVLARKISRGERHEQHGHRNQAQADAQAAPPQAILIGANPLLVLAGIAAAAVTSWWQIAIRPAAADLRPILPQILNAGFFGIDFYRGHWLVRCQRELRRFSNPLIVTPPRRLRDYLETRDLSTMSRNAR